MSVVFYSSFSPFYYIIIQAILTYSYIEIYIKQLKNKCQYGMWVTYYIPCILTLLIIIKLGESIAFDDPYYIGNILIGLSLIPLFCAHLYLGILSSGLADEAGNIEPYCR